MLVRSALRPARPRATVAALVLIAVLATLPVVKATQFDEPASHAPSPVPSDACVGLVLGGGGARGAAHIGVLRELERQRVPLCLIVGTSMGAIVGSLYASGRSADDIEEILAGIDWRDIFRDDPPRALLPMRRKDAQLNYRLEIEAGWRDGALLLPFGAVQGQKLGLLLRTLLPNPDQDFDALPIRFRAVAADILTGEAVVPDQGDLAAVVRASMSVPAVFAPIEIDGRLLVDGGIVDNLPIGIARRLGATHIIAVDVGSPLFTREQLRNPGDIAFQMVSVLMKERTDQEVATLGRDDLLIRPALGDFSAADFLGAASTISLGETATAQRAEEVAAFAVDAQQYRQWRADLSGDAPGMPTIEFVEVDGGQSKTAEMVSRRGGAMVGRPRDPERINQVIADVYAEGTYSHVGWKPVERAGRQGLLLQPIDKPWGPVFANVGLQFSDDFAGRSDYQLVTELVATGLSDDGDELRALFKLGRVSELSVDWFSPLDTDRRGYLRWMAGYQARNLPIALQGQQAAEYRLQRSGAAARLGWQPSRRWSAELGLGVDKHSADPVVGVRGFTPVRASTTSLQGRAVYDTLDAIGFPRSGARMELSLHHFVPWWGESERGTVARWRGDFALAQGEHNLLLGGRLARSWGRPEGLASFSTLGGFLNLSGEEERSLVGDRLAYARAVYYTRLDRAPRLFDSAPYFGFSAEAGNAWNDGPGSQRDPIAAGSLFVGMNSPFGPLLLGWGRSSRGNMAWSLSFGNLIRNDD